VLIGCIDIAMALRPELNREVSSTKQFMLDLLGSSSMSFWKITNSNGPTKLPYGTPAVVMKTPHR